MNNPNQHWRLQVADLTRKRLFSLRKVTEMNKTKDSSKRALRHDTEMRAVRATSDQ